MGKRPIVRRRGRSPNFMAPTHRRVAPAKYPTLAKGERLEGTLVALHHDPGRGAPLAEIRLDNGKVFHTVAVETMHVGQRISIGPGSPLAIGNIIPLAEAPEGIMLSNIERHPADGGALFRASGNYAVLIGKTNGTAILQDPKARTFIIDANSLATIGVIAGGGRTEKPFLKAGTKLKYMKSKGRHYPIVRGVAMISVYHPHGGGRHQSVSRSTSVSRNAPPGAKVGLIAPRKTGRKKTRRVSG
ncbi:MAG: 50S ribosomal protein L2 [Crenarchaeota archaeon]|nr:50S ribosomal protein L2 [Thermoproteota archaeon]